MKLEDIILFRKLKFIFENQGYYYFSRKTLFPSKMSDLSEKILEKHVSQPWFDMIVRKKGVVPKTKEGRLNKGDWTNLKEGDELFFFCDKEKIRVKVDGLTYFRNFWEAYQEHVRELIPIYGDLSENDVKNLYSEFFSNEDVETYGVVIISFVLIGEILPYEAPPKI